MNINRFIRGTFVALVGLFLLILLITGGNMLIFWSIFNWIQGGIHVITGLDTQLSKVFAALTLAVIVMLPFGRILLAFTPLPQKQKNVYRSLVFIGIAVFFSLTYWAARNTYFDPKTGQPVQYYSQLPSGEYRFYSEPGFDPLTGDVLKKVTPEVSMKSNGLWQENNSPFDPETGEPVQFYSQLPNGEFRFYPNPGFDPLTGEPLKKVTREVSLKSKGLWPSHDYHFDPETGEPLKYYSQMPDGSYRIYSEPGYDPVTGDLLKKITKEVSMKSRGLWPPEVPVKEPPKQVTSSTINSRMERKETSKNELPPKVKEQLKPLVTILKETAPASSKEDIQPILPPVSSGTVNFRNETSLSIRIHDSSGKLVNVVEPRKREKRKLKAGEYYHTDGKRVTYFTVEGGKTLNLRFYKSRVPDSRKSRAYQRPVRQQNPARNSRY